MIREILRPRAHKALIACSLVVVAVLTGLGVWTNKTAERQTAVEHKVKVQHTEIVQALCEKPFTKRCARHALNVIRTCLVDPHCSRLLIAAAAGATPIEGGTGPPESSNSSHAFAGGGNSSDDNFSPPGSGSPGGGSPGGKGGGGGHGSNPGGANHGHGGGGGGSPSPTPSPAPEEEHGVENPAGHEPPGQQPGQNPGKGHGVVPGLQEGVEGVVGCAKKFDGSCVAHEILGPSGEGD